MSDACCCIVCVRTQEVGVVEDFGQFKRLLHPGLACLKWPMERVVGRMSLRIQQLDVICETKTKDNVFVQVGVAVQYRVLVDAAYDAYYRLTDPRNQIQSYVFDVVRSTVPRMDLDEAFVSKDEVASAVLHQLRDVMKEYGYEIRTTLVTDLSPDNRVKASMNEINASRRLKEGEYVPGPSEWPIQGVFSERVGVHQMLKLTQIRFTIFRFLCSTLVRRSRQPQGRG